MKSPTYPHTRSRLPLRLKEYDYSTARAYFITIVTQARMPVFGEVTEGHMNLSDAGKMIQRVWHDLPGRFPSIALDEFIVMPNHIHGILIIQSPVGVPLVGTRDATRSQEPTDGDRATTRVAPTEDRTKTLGEMVGAYKSLTTNEYIKGVEIRGWPPFDKRLWQRNYYERIIRNTRDLDLAREYISNNPSKWQLDSENPHPESPPP